MKILVKLFKAVAIFIYSCCWILIWIVLVGGVIFLYVILPLKVSLAIFFLLLFLSLNNKLHEHSNKIEGLTNVIGSEIAERGKDKK